MAYRDFVDKFKEHGPGWAVRRLLFEAREPVTAPGRLLRNALAAAERAVRAARTPIDGKERHRGAANTLYAFYDLEILPLTYDVATFLALANLERTRRRLERLHVVVVPPHERARGLVDRGWPAAEFDDQRMLGILLPLLRMAEACRGHTLCATRAEAAAWRFNVAEHIFPAAYSPAFPVAPDFNGVWSEALTREKMFPLLRAGKAERAAIVSGLRTRIGEKAPVVISLRESTFVPQRNSNIDAWVAFADHLDPRRFAAVFVRDTERAFELPPPGLDRHVTFEAASWNAALRMALYELAYVNLAIMHGSMELCWYNEACRYVAFMPLGTAPQTSPEFLASRDFRIGQSLPFAEPWQRLAWAPDDAGNIEREFGQMVELLGAPKPADRA
jgi:hypothetical protein